MQFTTSNIALLVGALLCSSATADMDFWTGTCTNGFGASWQQSNLANQQMGECGGTPVEGSYDVGSIWTAQNPCNIAEKMTALPNGEEWNLYLGSKQVGNCYRGSRRRGVCQTISVMCTKSVVVWCRTAACT